MNTRSLVGYIRCSGEDLCDLFGLPDKGDGVKTKFEWNVRIDGLELSIYDYKNRESDLDDTYVSWHVGGGSKWVLWALKANVIASADETGLETLNDVEVFDSRMQQIKTEQVL